MGERETETDRETKTETERERGRKEVEGRDRDCKIERGEVSRKGRRRERYGGVKDKIGIYQIRGN